MKKEGVSELEDRPKIILAEEETKTADKKKKRGSAIWRANINSQNPSSRGDNWGVRDIWRNNAVNLSKFGKRHKFTDLRKSVALNRINWKKHA